MKSSPLVEGYAISRRHHSCENSLHVGSQPYDFSFALGAGAFTCLSCTLHLCESDIKGVLTPSKGSKPTIVLSAGSCARGGSVAEDGRGSECGLSEGTLRSNHSHDADASDLAERSSRFKSPSVRRMCLSGRLPPTYSTTTKRKHGFLSILSCVYVLL